MNHILSILQPLFHHYGYFAVFFMIFLEDFGLPTPGETTLIVGSVVAARGGLNIVEFALIAWVAAVLGDNVGYMIGRFAARAVIVRIARRLFISGQKIRRAEEVFRRHGTILVSVARFIDILRQLNGIVAGMAQMRWRRFFAFNAIGAGLWVAFWATLSYELGQYSANRGVLVQRIDDLFLGLFLMMVISFALWKVLTRGRRSAHSDENVRSDSGQGE